LVMCAACDDARGQILNVGIDRPTNFLELVETLIDVAGSGRWMFAPFTPERQAQEPGDFCSDIGKIRRIVGWSPQTSLREGLQATVDYYRARREHYWTAGSHCISTIDSPAKAAA
jgi:UDP-glucose 4-epimerase